MKRLLSFVGLKSIREIALTDAVATIRQTVSIRPEWFERNPDKRNRRPVNRYGTVSMGKIYETDHESVMKAGLPTCISEEISDSNALIGDVWRMAVEKTIADFNAKKSQSLLSLPRYEQLWLVSERVCREESKKFSASEALMTFHEACRMELGSLNIQERRLHRLTISRPLKLHKTCKISAPPPWIKPKLHKRFMFSCHAKCPLIPSTLNPCRVCGYEVDLRSRKSFRRCRKCNKPAHSKCIEKLFVEPRLFACRAISRPLARDAEELRPKPVIPPKPTLESKRCLICGDDCGTDSPSRVTCVESGCEYGAHEVCAAVLCRLNGGLLVSTEFRCNNVTHYLKPSEVARYCDCSSESLSALREIIQTRGRINYKNYTPRRQRYENPDVKCPKCDEVIGIAEANHVESYCTAPGLGTPIPSRDYEFVESRIRRVRKFILLDSLNPP